MDHTDSFIAVDWGTTNRRAYRIEAGAIVDAVSGGAGAAAVADFPAEVAAIRERLGDHSMLLAGMVGSTIGWRTVPYVPAPAGLEEVAAGLVRLDPRTAIVPGVAYRGDRADVMRGEEVQLLGAVAAGTAPPDALICQPGTHCKWATMVEGRIARFTTAMTGELFSLLRTHGLLAAQLTGAVADGPAFREGVVCGAERDLPAALFGIRAAGVLGLRDDADAASHASGLLIGADVAARLAEARTGRVHLIADPVLGALYAAAIETLDGEAVLVDSEASFVAGISRLWEIVR